MNSHCLHEVCLVNKGETVDVVTYYERLPICEKCNGKGMIAFGTPKKVNGNRKVCRQCEGLGRLGIGDDIVQLENVPHNYTDPAVIVGIKAVRYWAGLATRVEGDAQPFVEPAHFADPPPAKWLLERVKVMR